MIIYGDRDKRVSIITADTDDLIFQLIQCFCMEKHELVYVVVQRNVEIWVSPPIQINI